MSLRDGHFVTAEDSPLLLPRAMFCSSSKSSVLTQSRAEVSWFNTRLVCLTTGSSGPYIELFCSCLNNLGRNGNTILRDSEDLSLCMYVYKYVRVSVLGIISFQICL